MGFRARLCLADDLRRLVPHMAVTGLAGGIFGPDNGFLDPHELCMFLSEKLKALGGRLHQNCAVEGGTRKAGGYRLGDHEGSVRRRHGCERCRCLGTESRRDVWPDIAPAP